MRSLAAVALGLTLSVSPLCAQRAGTIDFGAHGRYSILDDDIGAENGAGVGGRVGLFILRNIALEFEFDRFAARAPGQDLKLQPAYLRLAYHKPMGESWAGIVGAAWLRDRSQPLSGGEFTDNGYSLNAGLQRKLGGALSLRADAIGDVVMSPYMETPAADYKTGNIHVNLGLNWRIGGGPGDADRDGVRDNVDACANTLRGETVDARGCVPPKDADGDGVVDPSDRCANTPAGTQVDANGCPRDADGDGVTDANDRCANTPAGTRVNATGCPLDTDGDGITDNADRCAGTPTGTRVDSNGCPVPVDSDGDGVLDTADACANTPRGTPVDGTGCPLPKDADDDSITDDKDACPGTAPGVRVDARGCAIIFEEGRKNVVLEGVTFASGKAELTAGSMTTLDRVAESLVNVKDVNVEVAGYTDNTGTRAVNIRLSASRAAAVRDYLVKKGVDAARITARGYGPEAPIAPNTTAAGRAQNRRVELKRTN
ncbi:MAG TPA: OmpA family protein [Gemmatimonadaceae bacterium]|nr:OmpA family protein [Gemmatimonadaceae bacterium]